MSGLYRYKFQQLIFGSSCQAINFMIQTVTVLLYVIWAGESSRTERDRVSVCSSTVAFSGLRIYAISSYSRLVTLAVVSLALVAVGTNIVRATLPYPFICLTQTSPSILQHRLQMYTPSLSAAWQRPPCLRLHFASASVFFFHLHLIVLLTCLLSRTFCISYLD